MADYKFIVVGSGISGCVFAAEAAEKGSVLILESAERPGGCLATLRHEDFWLEMGGHTIYSSYASYIDALKKENLVSRFLPRVKQPFKMLAPEGLVSIKQVMSIPPLIFNGWKLFFMKKEGKSVKEYWSSVLGTKNYEKMFRPMVQAVISQEGSDFPADMMLKSRPKDKSMPRSFTVFGGMDTYIHKISEHKNITLRVSCGAEHIKYENSVYTVSTLSGETFTAENVCVACYPAEAGKLLAEICPKAAELLSSIPSAKVESFGVVVPKNAVRLDALSFIVASDAPFTSVVSRDVVRDEKYRGFAFHFKPGRLSDDEKLKEAEKILGTSRDAFVAAENKIHFCPTLSKGHEEKIKELDRHLSGIKGLFITGNYFTGLAIEDCAIRSTKEAARI